MFSHDSVIVSVYCTPLDSEDRIKIWDTFSKASGERVCVPCGSWSVDASTWV